MTREGRVRHRSLEPFDLVRTIEVHAGEGREPGVEAQNQWRRNREGTERQIQDVLRLHPHWREPGDPAAFVVLGSRSEGK